MAASALDAAAEVPRTLTHQGFLTENGAPLEGPQELRFALFPSEADNAGMLHNETVTVVFEQGYYSVVLGKTVPIDPMAFDVPQLFLEVTLRPGQEANEVIFSPRQEITSVPFSMVAAHVVCDGCINAKSISPQGVSGTNLADESVSGAKISVGAVGTVAIENSAVNSAKVLDESLTGSDIQDGSISQAEIANGTITAADVNAVGGIYSSKSAIYIASDTVIVQGGQCTTATAKCLTSKDLPIQGACTPPPVSNSRIRSTAMYGWESTTQPAEYSCTMCNEGANAENVDATIACIHAP